MCVCVRVHTCTNMCGGGGRDLFFISGNAALPEGRQWQTAGRGPFQGLILGLLHPWRALGPNRSWLFAVANCKLKTSPYGCEMYPGLSSQCVHRAGKLTSILAEVKED